MNEYDPLLDQLEEALRQLLDVEETRLKNQQSFLKKVAQGSSEGATLESLSTGVTDEHLQASLDRYFPG